MQHRIKALIVGAFFVLGLAQQAHSGLITEVVIKLSDNTADANKLNAETGWTGAGGFNEGNATAALLDNNGLDYKNALVDAWPTNMTNVRVLMYS